MDSTKQTAIPVSDQIAEIMDEVDFQKIRHVMQFLEWVWHDEGIPTIESLRATAMRLLQDVAEREGRTYIATGGFWARKDQWGLLSLQFVITDWDVSDENLEAP